MFQFRAADCGVPFLNLFYKIRCNDAEYLWQKLMAAVPKFGYDTSMVAQFPTTTPQGLDQEFAKLELNGNLLFSMTLDATCMELSEGYARLKEGENLRRVGSEGVSFEKASPGNAREISFLLYADRMQGDEAYRTFAD
eukprot:gb/GECG01008170.1/.p1 GENE.gb/GECG01008170.1/~~gb/GECG01008170.1/.p1  ORF type:complete len:138 (+),score=19.97 gb/GECG01008170.1/:1-414(+)